MPIQVMSFCIKEKQQRRYNKSGIGHTAIIPSLGMLREEEHKLKASVSCEKENNDRFGGGVIPRKSNRRMDFLLLQVR